MKKKRITFTFHAPEAKSVHIAGSFNDWNIDSDPLSQGKEGGQTARGEGSSTWNRGYMNTALL